MGFFEDAIILAYAVLPLINGYAYYPQAVKLYKCTPEEARSTSLGAWSLWVGCTLVGLLYSGVIIQDTLYTLSCCVNFIACTTITLLTVRQRLLDDDPAYSSRWVRSIRSWRSWASKDKVAIGRASSLPTEIGSPVSSQ